MLYQVALELCDDLSIVYIHAECPKALEKALEDRGCKVLEIEPYEMGGPATWPHPDDIFESVEHFLTHIS